jgi:hypothetical protein
MVSLSEFLVESEYELWAKEERHIPALLKFAEELRKLDKIALAKHSFGRGFNENYALIYPVYREGTFCLVMAMTKMRKEYKHLMPMASALQVQEKIKVPVPMLLAEI